MLSLIAGQEYTRVGGSAGRGVEYHGPCPQCGGNDRFHIWPEHPQGAQFWCRGCGKGGDLIEFYRWRDNLSYRDACARAGVDARTYAPHSAPRPQAASKAAVFTPQQAAAPAETWTSHAAKFADYCHQQLLQNDAQQAWLQTRGIDSAMIAKYGLGWNPSDAYRPRESWGLPTETKANGQAKKLWLPLGLVIPRYQGEAITCLRIRRPNPADGEQRYYVVPGSSREPLLSDPGRTAYVIVESDLDAILLDGLAGDLVGTVAMGNASIKPTAALHQHLQAAHHLSISLDADKIKPNRVTGKPESAGAQGSLWWLATYRTAERVPIIGGKDPGDAYQAGVDVRAWVLAGLPPRFQLASSPVTRSATPNIPAATPSSRPQGEISTQPNLNHPEEQLGMVDETNQQPTNHAILTLHSGQEIHVTDDPTIWQQLADTGLIVFSNNELIRLQTALTGLDAQDREAAVQAAVDAKAIFSGAYIRRGEVMA